MTALLVGRLRELATQTHLLETKVSSLGWMAAADVLQTVGNLITAFDITDEELAQSMDDCLVRNQERGRL